MKDWLLDKFYYRRKYNTLLTEKAELKVENYDLNKKLKNEKEIRKNNLEKISKIKSLPRDIKKKYGL